MRILGIETSCDETAVAIVDDGSRALSNAITSSKATFGSLAGVIPEQAAREQVECMIPVLRLALEEANSDWQDIDAIAVTRGPGLLGSLLVGTVTARALGRTLSIPVIGVHHTLGHLSSTWLDTKDTPSFPIVTLSASGGHTDLWMRTSHARGTLLGRTRDDAAGEAFDKGASMLGLPYPGGPSIQKAAENGNSAGFSFPQPLHNEEGFDFSFSGLKTSLKYLLRDNEKTLRLRSGQANQRINVADFAASFQDAICRHLLDRVTHALKAHPDIRELHIVGGVSANLRLREMAEELCARKNVRLRVPATLGYCTDNGAMIASAGYFLVQELGDAAYAQFQTKASMPLEAVIAQ